MIRLPAVVRIVIFLVFGAGVVLYFQLLTVPLDRTRKFINIHPQSPQSNATSSSDAFDFPALDSEAIRGICADTQWNPALVFTCSESVGGIGNIRNSILNCVRFAISAGAALVEPTIVLRNDADSAEIRTGVKTSMEYMFDPSHFRESLRLSCPGLKVYDRIEDLKGKAFHDPIALLPESLEEKVPAKGLAHPEKWRESFYAWLSEHVGPTPEGTMIINLQRSYLIYPIYSDGENFALSFGKLLKFRADTRILATKTLLALAANESYTLDLSQPIPAGFFFGAHLRTEHDAQLGWPAADWVYGRYDTQAKFYFKQVLESEIRRVYIASGDQEEVAKFAGEAVEKNITVSTKFDVLGPEDVAQLKEMSWDQQGMVDFLVMLRSSQFVGVGHSSFAWNVALVRHTFAQQKDHLRGPHLLNDELSDVYGYPKQYPEYASCLWP
ncbi:hypothetical protein V495_04643 [Pseudogymnoascus sp. VKM F-4514 (FW-929)]|nr:hypothetical protein V495_04643 [Pseudogymnoascus sp. VKM F-4514 (FW-929)]KFY65246.1 hypothetical protein V497_01446 [Pseudogymnoascus sp. VKM F-4516 (FW-969)]